MKLQLIYDQLTNGELSNFNIGGYYAEDCGENACEQGIKECDYRRVNPHINLGLIELYTLFPIKIEQMLLNLNGTQHKYLLDPRNLLRNNPDGFLDDTGYAPFESCLRVDRIYDAATGDLQPLNVNNHLFSLNTDTFNTLNVPIEYCNSQLLVSYRALPRMLLATDDPATTEVDLPTPMLRSLLLFVGIRAMSGMNASIDQQSHKAGLIADYDKSINILKTGGVSTHNGGYVSQFELRGFI